ncbi:MAG: hypothetical protein ABR500_12790 [Dermatophilaceae bacterium]
MHLIAEVETLTESQLLDHAEAVALQQRRCEVQQMRLAVQHAIIHNADRLDPDQSRLPGRERARLFGGPGTPLVTSFAPATLGARMGVSSTAASSLIADSLDIVMRLPRLWARVEALEVKPSYARHVARRTRDLPFEQADLVDEAVAEPADGRVPWTRFEQLVDGAIVASDPEAAASRERAAAEEVFARRTRSTESGIRGFQIRAPFPVVTLLDARVTWFAEVLKALGDERTTDERRVAAVALLADPPAALELMRRFQQWRDRPEDPPMPPPDPDDPEAVPCPTCASTAPREAAPEVDWSAILPAVRLFLHYYPGQGPQTGGDPPGRDPTDKPPRWEVDHDVGAVVRTEGHGPVTPEWVRKFLGKDARFTITPVLDLVGQAPVDAYEIPDRHRHAVHLMSPADVFPWGTSTSRRKEIDHTIPYVHGLAALGAAQSRVGNYGPLSGYHHRVKTHGGWQVQQPFPGIYLWRDPHGRFYLVDHTGTRRLSSPRTRPRQQQESRVEWTFTEMAVEYDLTA